MRLAWGTDVHLNFLKEPEVRAYGASARDAGAEAFLITGDIAEGRNIEAILTWLVEGFAGPIFYVLGNHDYYYRGIDVVRRSVAFLGVRDPRLVYLPDAPAPLALSETLGLVGVDGWGDARLGAPETSQVFLNDFRLIDDLGEFPGPALFRKLRALGDREAALLRPRLAAALAQFPRVLVATHVPPFAEAAWHEGKRSADDWLPYFTCKAVGDVLLEAADAHPARQITVLCGHTHSPGEAQLRPNLRVVTGGARYGRPVFEPLPEEDP